MTNSYDEDGIAALFVENGRWVVEFDVGGANEGREEIKAFFAGLSEAIEWTQHYMLNPIVEVADDGRTATGSFRLLTPATILRTNDPSQRDAVIIMLTYNDKFVKRDGRWYFAELRGKMHHVSNWTEGWVNQPMRP